MAGCVGLLAWGFVACQRGASPASGGPVASAGASTTTAAPAPTGSSLKKPMTPEEEAQFQGNKPDEVPLLLGPAPATVGPAEHEQRLKELLSGQTPAERLPLVATASDVAYDVELYDSLTTELDTRKPVDVMLHVGSSTPAAGKRPH